jgi:predicted nucleic acid-binding protein
MKSLLDTNILTAFLKGNQKVVNEVEDYVEEYLRGLKDLGNRKKLKAFDDLMSRSEIFLLDKSTADKASEIYVRLKKRGSLIGDAEKTCLFLLKSL